MNEAHTAPFSETSAEHPADRAFLVVYHGEGSRVVDLLDGVEVTFGRSRTATVFVDDPKVSRLHARVIRRGGAIVVEDLGSRNGTRVNGRGIEEATRVSSGDEIGVGPAAAVVGLSRPDSPRCEVALASVLDARLVGEVDRGRRFGRRLGLIMIRLEGASAAVESAIDRLGRKRRAMDLFAEYGADEYGILLPEADRGATRAAADAAVREARSAGATSHAGLASFPEDGTSSEELLSRARAALRLARLGGGEDGVAQASTEPATASAELVIADAQMERVMALARRVADKPISVLILGETGVGKEVVAEAIHELSGRRGPLVKLNCASLPPTLLESELFGHERGAFTGAERRKAGFFEAADGGTLFLDEIGELPEASQIRLLRVLESRAVTRLGGTKETPIDVRVVCATNRDLEGDVATGRFRRDLFFRVNGFTILVPPLRDRRQETAPLAEHFARLFARELGQPTPTISPEAHALLAAWSWPGNVRELRNVIERAVVLQADGRLEAEHLPDRVRAGAAASPGPAGPGEPAAIRDRIAEIERAAIVAALEATGGNQTRAAARLGLSRRTLIYKMEKYGLKPSPGHGER